MSPDTEPHELKQWPSLAQLRFDLYMLLAIVVASKSIAELANTRAEHLEDLLDTSPMEQEELTRLLISVAINLRVFDDRNGRKLAHMSNGIGSLYPEIPALPSQEVPASLRDICNKLVHAESVEVERTRIAEHCTYVQPVVSCYGTEANRRGKRRWLLRFDVVDFVHESLLCLHDIEYRKSLLRPK